MIKLLLVLFRYLIEHPEYMVDGLSMAQFSFQIPRPLQENYVRKRPAAPRLTAADHASRTLEPTEGEYLLALYILCINCLSELLTLYSVRSNAVSVCICQFAFNTLDCFSNTCFLRFKTLCFE